MPRKRKGDGSSASNQKHEKLEDKLIENLIELQKVHTTLLERFDKLTAQISSLLTLFEMTARSFAENPVNQASQKDKEFLEKIDKLLDQNKTIAKGLTLMEERIRGRVYGTPVRTEQPKKAPEDEFQPSMSPSPGPFPRVG